MKNLKVIITIVIIIIGTIFISFIFKTKNTEKEQLFLKKYGLDNMSVHEMVPYLDQKLDEEKGFKAFITASTLTIGDDTNTFDLKVPNDLFYLSLAPYIDKTHPCANHNLITCRGELKNKTVHILIKDNKEKIIINSEYTTFANGFIGIWLPKNIKGTITVTYNGLAATEEITTNSSSNTCLTTLKLT